MDKSQMITAYGLISELFLYPEARDADRVRAGSASLENAPREVREPIAAFLAAPAAADPEEYVRTLELTPLVPLYLGSLLYEEPHSCRGAGMSGRNGYMLELSNIYRHFGVEFAGREMADFVPVIVEFLGLSLKRSEIDQIGLRRYFVEELLCNAIESLLSAMRQCDSPYGYLVEALRATLGADIALMAGGPKWQPPADDDYPRTAANAGSLPNAQGVAFDNGIEL